MLLKRIILEQTQRSREWVAFSLREYGDAKGDSGLAMTHQVRQWRHSCT